MRELFINCSIEQGFNFRRDVQCEVGHINTIKIGETVLTPDTEVMEPTKLNEDSGKVKVVGVASQIYWEGGCADPIFFSCQISTANMQKVSTLTEIDLINTNVEFSFTFYKYDPTPDKQVYYKSVHTNEIDLKSLIMEDREFKGRLAISIADNQSSLVMSPRNYTFTLWVISPDSTEQDIHRAKSVDSKFVKKWGSAG